MGWPGQYRFTVRGGQRPPEAATLIESSIVSAKGLLFNRGRQTNYEQANYGQGLTIGQFSATSDSRGRLPKFVSYRRSCLQTTPAYRKCGPPNDYESATERKVSSERAIDWTRQVKKPLAILDAMPVGDCQASNHFQDVARRAMMRNPRRLARMQAYAYPQRGPPFWTGFGRLFS